MKKNFSPLFIIYRFFPPAHHSSFSSIVHHSLVSLILCFTCLSGTVASAAGNIDTTDKYAWSESCGWHNYAPTHGGVTVHPDGANGYLSGYVWSQNIGWIKLGAGTGPYANTAANNYGINMDANGNLSGYAWSEVGGWINFNPTHSQVTINLTSGCFIGYAWSLFGGWINFNNTSPQAYKVRTTLVKPLAPTGISASSGTYTDKVRIAWNAVNDATSYEVWRHTSNNSDSAPRIASGVTDTSYDDTGVSAGVTYYYWIKAVNAAGSSGFSAPESGYVSNLPDPELNQKAVYRFYSYGAPESTYTHLWTINEAERDALTAFPSWQYEGIAWYALPDFVEGSVPLYRLYEPDIRRHFYTINVMEYFALEATSWNGEGTQYYVYADDMVPGLVPVYRFDHGVNQSHHFTIDENEKDTIIATPDWGYTYEGIAFYVFTNPTEPSLKHSGILAGISRENSYSRTGLTYLPQADYTGDGLPDTVIYDETTGYWYILPSGNQTETALSFELFSQRPISLLLTASSFVTQWGGPGFIAVPGDYNGDGIYDLTVYEESSGLWHICFMMQDESDFSLQPSSLIPPIQWGGPGFEPVPGDHTGDGISDLGIRERATGILDVLPVPGL